MASSTTASAHSITTARTQLIVFGPQTSCPPKDFLAEIRKYLLSEPRLGTFLEALKNLPSLWDRLVRHDQSLKAVPGRETLERLGDWIQHGGLPDETNAESNMFGMPLTIIIHIVQYFHYLDGNISHTKLMEDVSTAGVQGFCLGLLSAVAVGCARQEAEVNALAAVALRLAVCIGAYIDLQRAYTADSFDTVSLAVRWKSTTSHNLLLEVLQTYPEAYVSVISDSTDLSITVAEADAASITNHLLSLGITVRPTGLRGRLHSEVNWASLQKILNLAELHRDLQFPPAERLLVPIRSNKDGHFLTGLNLQKHVLQNIMTTVAHWHLCMTSTSSDLLQSKAPWVLSFGTTSSIPPSLIRQAAFKVVKAGSSRPFLSKDMEHSPPSTPGTSTPLLLARQDVMYPDNAIAVIGMACKFPGADSVEEFWEVLKSGTSQLGEIPASRFETQQLRRSADKDLRFWGNFIRDAGAFDHRFFKKSSREAAAMDPQQRLLLQVAYQTLESSGYFAGPSARQPMDIGCYIGACSSDYNDNVASHPPSAYSSLGTLRAFMSGKISHYFGWTGPSLTIDTACSSSAVAIHTACRAIDAGECSEALAGGVSIFTSPNFYQNLAAASFLSPTGATKPFDAAADGYCRGEGIGFVHVKKLSAAIADGDNVLGVISGSAVNQNQNCTTITVPHHGSQVELYHKVCSIAGLAPSSISFVEAHGTGTPVGDPIEFESIRQVFGGGHRTEPLHVASVKGNIGHLEGASGVAALIKVLLMLQHGSIPLQTNFSTLNPKIPALEPDKMIIPRNTTNWTAQFKAACINNYGAAGSNATMIVTQAPSAKLESLHVTLPKRRLKKFPVYISANTKGALDAYCKALMVTISRLPSSTNDKDALASLAFNINIKQNRALTYFISRTVDDMATLERTLQSVSETCREISKPKPVVLVFGGQSTNRAGLNRGIYDASILLQRYLDDCDHTLRSLNLTTLYPGIFTLEPIHDVVKLHSFLFSLQYATAMAWIDCGVKPAALVGHSFGQLTALCVSGALRLEDALRLVTGRAALIQEHWGSERGAMVSVDADIDVVMEIIADMKTAGHTMEIACFNGPTSHVLVGRQASIEHMEIVFAARKAAKSPVKYKVLGVTHGFHSVFTEPLISRLNELAGTISYGEPIYEVETCSDQHSWARIEPHLVAEHTRVPVYFGQAINRIERRLGPCTWLEAGSGSPAIAMVRRALAPESVSSHTLQPIQLGNDRPTDLLADAVVNLWREGHSIHFWPYHRSQSNGYVRLNLPPYQFEKSLHWLKWIDHAALPSDAPPSKVESGGDPELLTFARFLDPVKQQAELLVETRSTEWKLYVQGHAVLAESLCPAPLYIELVARAIKILAPELRVDASLRVDDLDIMSPLGVATDRLVLLNMQRTDASSGSWGFAVTSHRRGSPKLNKEVTHAVGKVSSISNSSSSLNNFERYERLVGLDRAERLIADTAAEAMQGSMIYKVFSKVVNYADFYKGVRSVYAKGCDVTATITLPELTQPILGQSTAKPLAVDNFIQVVGLQLNCLNACKESDVFVCTKVDRLQMSSAFMEETLEGKSWTVYSNFSTGKNKDVISDIFVFDRTTQKLGLHVLGVHFQRIMKKSLAKILSQSNMIGDPSSANSEQDGQPHSSPNVMKAAAVAKGQISGKEIMTLLDQAEGIENHTKLDSAALPATGVSGSKESHPTSPGPSKTPRDVKIELLDLLFKITEIPVAEMKDELSFDDVGIDSLMVIEVLSEIRKYFHLEIPMSDFQTLTTIKLLYDYLWSKGSNRNAAEVAKAEVSSEDTSDSDTGNDMAAQSSSASSMSGEDLPERKPSNEVHPRVKFEDQVANSTPAHADHAGPMGSSAFTTQSPPHSASNATQQPSLEAPDTAGSTPIDYQQAFEEIRNDFDIYAQETGFQDFWKIVYPRQAQLVLAYTVAAFTSLRCPVASLKMGEVLPPIKYLSKHKPLVKQLYNILADAGLVTHVGNNYIRTDKAVDPTGTNMLLRNILRDFPKHANEHRLLNITGSKLAACLSGSSDPLQLLFRAKADRDLLADVYANGPMYKAISKLLSSFLEIAYSEPQKTFQILEIGAGTGGTTKHIVNFLEQHRIRFHYTFSDVSGSLVHAARRHFGGRDNMEFVTLDIEKALPEQHLKKYDTVISTNCIHATRNLTTSLSHIQELLSKDGFVSLVEFTRNMFWFDLVFGLLEGWWLFEDGRTHVLADTDFWEKSLKDAGFQGVGFSDGDSEEAQTLRIISGFTSQPQTKPVSATPARSGKFQIETVVWKTAGSKPLYADIYIPPAKTPGKRPVALLIHGGGHCMFTRKEVDLKQMRLMHDAGYLPVSVDYRFCPELGIIEGPMADVSDALQWVRTQLPLMRFPKWPGLSADGAKVIVVGWSTGGTLAMSTAFTSLPRQIRPPEAILAFFCPTDYEDDWWKNPVYPNAAVSSPSEPYDLLEGIEEEPITSWYPQTNKGVPGMLMSLKDKRWRFILHMNWKAQTLPLLLNGLPSKRKAASTGKDSQSWSHMEMPDLERVRAISPYAQIIDGNYRTPTYIIHGTADDMIPWQQSRKTIDALTRQGVAAGIYLLDGAEHLFDTFGTDRLGGGDEAIRTGYKWLFANA